MPDDWPMLNGIKPSQVDLVYTYKFFGNKVSYTEALLIADIVNRVGTTTGIVDKIISIAHSANKGRAEYISGLWGKKPIRSMWISNRVIFKYDKDCVSFDRIVEYLTRGNR